MSKKASTFGIFSPRWDAERDRCAVGIVHGYWHGSAVRGEAGSEVVLVIASEMTLQAEAGRISGVTTLM